MNTNDIMIDLESLGTDFDAPIIAIGAIAFDRTTGKLGQTFYKEISLDSAIRSGRVSGSTVAWWVNQSPRARHIFATPDSEKSSLSTVLFEFMSWLRSTGKGTPRVWAKGPAEDITWLQHALVTGCAGVSAAWHYTNVRDVRGIVELAEELAGFDVKTVPDVGVAHNAIDDATYQAKCVSAAYAALRGGSVKANVLKPNTDAAKRVIKPKTPALVDDEL